MKYGLEIDALNAIYAEQRRTNELLEQLLERSFNHDMHTHTERPDDSSTRNERKIHVEDVSHGVVQPSTGNRGRGRKRVG